MQRVKNECGATLFYWNPLVLDFVSLGVNLPKGTELRLETVNIVNAPPGYAKVATPIPQYPNTEVFVKEDEVELAAA